jgi:hypothetical protein
VVVGAVAIAAVAVLLAATAVRQQGRLGPRTRLLDALAIVPQWKFFGDTRLGAREGALDDLHLVARDWMGGDRVGAWLPVLSPGCRRWSHALWNPSLRPELMLLSFADDLAARPDATASGRVTTSLAYLVLLRECLDGAPRSPDARGRQFAIVRTRGRDPRSLAIAFVSAWHEW